MVDSEATTPFLPPEILNNVVSFAILDALSGREEDATFKALNELSTVSYQWSDAARRRIFQSVIIKNGSQVKNILGNGIVHKLEHYTNSLHIDFAAAYQPEDVPNTIGSVLRNDMVGEEVSLSE